MKTLLRIVGIGLLGGLSLGGSSSALANLEVAASVQIHAVVEFDAPLAVHGSWVEVRSHGRCWRPARVAVGWRPYCDGSWVWTDCGWYWNSDEPWAWACYHYGTWVFDSNFGWLWVPDIEWAPAWVYWRVGGGFIGWAPCPPRGVIVAPRLFSFVAVGHFHERVRPSTVVVNDMTIINKTTGITEVNRASRNIGGTWQKVYINEGPGVAMIQKATGKKITAIPIQAAVRQTASPPVKTRETGQPADKAPSKFSPAPNRPAGVTPESSAKPVPPDNAPSKKQSGSPAERHYKIGDPSVEPRLPEGKVKSEDYDKRQGKGHDKGKP